MAGIPPDLIRDILSRMPLKDLVRFRCVSKFFETLIDCPYFNNLHLSHSKQTNSNFYGIIIDPVVEFRDPQFIKLIDLSKSVNEVSVVTVNPPPDLTPMKFCKVVASCNGLIALCYRTKRNHIIIVWNPFTGKFKKVDLNISPNEAPITYGFGYDSKTDDYKLVKIMGKIHSGGYRVTLKAAVYSLKTNSWKKISKGVSVSSKFYGLWRNFDGVFGDLIGRHGLWIHPDGVSANDALHWRISWGSDTKIIAFDLVKEELHNVPIAGCFRFDVMMDLCVLDGCLAVTCGYDNRTYVSVMKEYGIKESWTEALSYFNSKYDCFIHITPLAYSRSRDKILLRFNNAWYWYDLFSKKFEMCLDESYGSRTYFGTFTGSSIALNDSTYVVDLMKKQTNMKYNEKTRKEEINLLQDLFSGKRKLK